MSRSSANGNSDERGAAGGAGVETLSGDQSLPETHESGDDVPGVSGAGDPGVLARGSAVGRYVVLEKLGAGATGVVRRSPTRREPITAATSPAAEIDAWMAKARVEKL